MTWFSGGGRFLASSCILVIFTMFVIEEDVANEMETNLIVFGNSSSFFIISSYLKEVPELLLEPL